MTDTINESLQYLDMEHQVYPILGVDQYKSKIGDDSEFVTIDFTVKSKSVTEDLVIWLERGYDWIIDSEESPGEVKNNQYLVFAEMNRRTWVPKRIMELLFDFETLTGIKAGEWKLRIGEKLYPATEQNIKDHVTLSPHEYRIDRESELNEWREMAGLDTVSIYETDRDQDLLEMKRQAGII
jgi:hypothetical protein